MTLCHVYDSYTCQTGPSIDPFHVPRALLHGLMSKIYVFCVSKPNHECETAKIIIITSTVHCNNHEYSQVNTSPTPACHAKLLSVVSPPAQSRFAQPITLWRVVCEGGTAARDGGRVGGAHITQKFPRGVALPSREFRVPMNVCVLCDGSPGARRGPKSHLRRRLGLISGRLTYSHPWIMPDGMLLFYDAGLLVLPGMRLRVRPGLIKSLIYCSN